MSTAPHYMICVNAYRCESKERDTCLHSRPHERDGWCSGGGCSQGEYFCVEVYKTKEAIYESSTFRGPAFHEQAAHT